MVDSKGKGRARIVQEAEALNASLNDHSFSSRASTLQPVTSPDGSRQLGEIENVSVNTLGFTELATGGERPFLDIVLVHGLQGHPRTTWEYKGKHPAQELGQGQEEESKTRKLWDFFKGRKKIKREYTNFWPETNLSKDFPEARIMTFGYDSHIAQRDGPVNLTNITDHGGALLNGLRYRRKKEPDRPMLFLAHSLGGLIVKSALWQSFVSLDDDRKRIAKSTFAIVFFGTPHRGGAYVNIGQTMAAIARMTGASVNLKVLANLKGPSEILSNLRAGFSTVLKQNDMKVTTFWEGKGLSGIPGFKGKVVDVESCKFDDEGIEQGDYINANHMDMVKFSGSNDPEYEKVKAELERHIERIKTKSQKEPWAAVTGEQRDATRARYLDSLDIPEMYRRHDQITRPSTYTLAWVYDSAPGLSQWLSAGDGIFWVQGKPGSGKSTLMRYLYHHPTTAQCLAKNLGPPNITSPRQWNIIGLFFTNRENQIQRDLQGMLTAMLHRLLLEEPRLIDEVVEFSLQQQDLHKQTVEPSSINAVKVTVPSWTSISLQGALLHCRRQSKIPFNVCFFIDALDEHEGDQEAFSKFLRQLVNDSESRCTRVKICVASRPEQFFKDYYQSCPGFSMQQYTSPDMQHFIDGRIGDHVRFRELNIGPHKIQKLRDEIVSKADGVFLWVVLITEELKVALDQGRDALSRYKDRMLAYYDIVRITPAELDVYYRESLLRRIDQSLRQKAFVMLESILRARTPLTLQQLGYIIQQQEAKLSASRDINSVRFDALSDPKAIGDPKGLQRFITSCCRGLLELERPSQRYSRRTWSVESGNSGNILRVRSQMLKHSNLEHRDDIVSDNASSDGSVYALPREPDEYKFNKFDFTTTEQPPDYHARSAVDLQSTVRLFHRSAKDFLLKSQNLDELFSSQTNHQGRKMEKPSGNGHLYALEFCLRYLKTEMDNPNAWRQLGLKWDVIEEVAYHAPRADHARISPFFTFTLLDVLDDHLTTLHSSCWPVHWFYSRWSPRYQNIDTWHFDFKAYAVAADMQGYMKHVLHRESSILKNKPGRPLLHFALYMLGFRTNPETVELLLGRGADIEATFDGKTALESMLLWQCDASGQPQLSLARILLNHGANVEGQIIVLDETGQKLWFPLLHAAIWHRKALNIYVKGEWIQLLLEYGADPNSIDIYGRTFVESLYGDDVQILRAVWKLIFNKGGKITKSMLYTKLHDERVQSPELYDSPGWHDSPGLYDSPGLHDSPGLYAEHRLSQPHRIRDMLRELEFRQKSYYTLEALAIARKYNPQWHFDSEELDKLDSLSAQLQDRMEVEWEVLDPEADSEAGFITQTDPESKTETECAE